MKLVARLTTAGLSLGIILGIAFHFGGCDADWPFGAKDPEIVRKIVQSDVGPIRLLNVRPEIQPLRKGEAPGRGLYATKVVHARTGGSVFVGDERLGLSRIQFGEEDLSADTKVQFRYAANGFLTAEFEPHGSLFNHPVKLQLSYKMADLRGVNEDRLRVYYHNDHTGIWELVGGAVDKAEDVVTVFIKHFSRYTLGEDE